MACPICSVPVSVDNRERTQRCRNCLIHERTSTPCDGRRIVIPLVGEMGAGKTTVARALHRLKPGTYSRVASGDASRDLGPQLDARGLDPREEQIREVVRRRIIGTQQPIVLLDGMPRTIEQWEWLKGFGRDLTVPFAIGLVNSHSTRNLHERARQRHRDCRPIEVTQVAAASLVVAKQQRDALVLLSSLLLDRGWLCVLEYENAPIDQFTRLVDATVQERTRSEEGR